MAKFVQLKDDFDPGKDCGLCGAPLDFNEATKQLAIAVGALTIALLDNHVITSEQYDKALAQATAIIDQEFAAKRDRAGGEEKDP